MLIEKCDGNLSDSILHISKRLLADLNANGINYCHWKNNHCINRSLAGKDDLDLLVREKDYDGFRSIITALGFKEAYNRHIQFPGIFHFYGLDTPSGKLLHLHVHTRLVTGESHTKNYHLPLEEMVLQNVRCHTSGCNIPEAEVDLIIYVLRYYIKISCLTGAYLLWKRKHYVRAEFDYSRCNVDNHKIDHLLERYFCFFTPGFFHEMVAALASKSSFMKRISLGLQLRKNIKTLRRLSAMRTMWARYYQVIYRALNKVLMKKKKSLSRGGRIIAVTGLDGSGKSTVNRRLLQWLKPVLNVRLYHVGRPKPVCETLMLRGLLKTKKSLNSNSHKDAAPRIHQRNILFAMRYLVLAYERYRLLRKADKLRAKGYFVFCDRYPSLNFGAMDSPKIGQVQGQYLYNLFGTWEKELYAAMPIPDAVYNLKIPVDLALERNRVRIKGHKESDAQMRYRYKNYSDLQYRAGYYEVIDAARELPHMMKDIKAKIWKRI